MHLRAMRHSTIQVVPHQGHWLPHVASSAIAVGRVSAALLSAVLKGPPTASPVPAGTLGLLGEPGLDTAREQDDGKAPP